MKKMLACLALILTAACSQTQLGGNASMWDSMRYSNHVAAEPSGLLRMGK